MIEPRVARADCRVRSRARKAGRRRKRVGVACPTAIASRPVSIVAGIARAFHRVLGRVRRAGRGRERVGIAHAAGGAGEAVAVKPSIARTGDVIACTAFHASASRIEAVRVASAAGARRGVWESARATWWRGVTSAVCQ